MNRIISRVPLSFSTTKRIITTNKITIIKRTFSTKYNNNKNNKNNSNSKNVKGWLGIEELREKGWERYATERSERALALADDISFRSKSMTPEQLIQSLDQISSDICSVADPAEVVRSLHQDREAIESAERAYLIISNVIIRLNSDAKLYQAFRDKIFNTPGALESMPAEYQDYAKQIDLEFKDYGIQLSEHERESLGVLWNDVHIAMNQYRIESENENNKISIPNHILQKINSTQYFGTAKKIKASDCTTVWNSLSNPSARESLYEHVVGAQWNGTGAGKSMETLEQLVTTRHKLATKLGYKSYAEMSLREKVAKTPEAVCQFLDQYYQRCLPQAKKEFDMLLAAKSKEEGPSTKIYPYDSTYYSRKLIGYNIDSSKSINVQMSEYLSPANCIDGLNIVAEQVFGVSLVSVPLQPGETWHPDVFKMALVNKSEKRTMGYIYFDLFTREGKTQVNANFALALRHKKNYKNKLNTNLDDYTTPVTVLSTSVSPYGLSLSDLETLFHEFGHSLHIILGKSEFQHTVGFRGPQDFTEFPSGVVEKFAFEESVVRLFAKHRTSGATMPIKLHNEACSVESHFVGLETVKRIYYSMLDQRMYAGLGNVKEISQRTFKDYMLLSPSPSGFFECPGTIIHFGGYGSIYYTYLFTQMLSSVTWQRMFKDNPLSREAGAKFTQKALVPSFRRDQASVLVDLLGFYPSPKDVFELSTSLSP